MAKTVRVSESVCAGHPDKLADQISDAILDAALRQDSNARVAVETLVAKETIVLAGEIHTTAHIDYAAVARGVVRENGYRNPAWGFDDTATIHTIIHEQSPEIAVGVTADGAGDQGLMYGYATDETMSHMPLPITLAHEVCKQIDAARMNKRLPYIRPDGKAQVVVAYERSVPVAVEHVTVAVPHEETVPLQQVKADIEHHILRPLLAEYGMAGPREVIVNGTGVWHMPGPASDVGLTGRKIVVDTYGGAAKVGGGALSGKDPSKVDRSGAYAARFVAKNIVANGLAARAEVCLAYYIGAKKPIVQSIDTFGTQRVSQKAIQNAANILLDCSVKAIIEQLRLRQPIYKNTAVYGHFGKPELPWEAVVAIP